MIPLLFLILPIVAAAVGPTGPDCAEAWRAEFGTKEAWACLCRAHGTAEDALKAAKEGAACGEPAEEAAPVPAFKEAARAADGVGESVDLSLKAGGIATLYGERALKPVDLPPPPPANVLSAAPPPTRPNLQVSGPQVKNAMDPRAAGVAALKAAVSGPPEAQEAVARARDLLGRMLDHADPEVVANLVRRQVKVVVIGRHQKLTDAPEFKDLKGKRTFDGRPWDGVRGVGSHRLPDGGWALAVAEENLDDSGTGGYPPRFLFVHEFAHMVQLRGLPSYVMGRASPEAKARGIADAKAATAAAATGPQRRRAALFAKLAELSDGSQASYEGTMQMFKTEKARKGLGSLSDYANSNAEEFFAEATAAYFGVEFKGNTKERLADLLQHRPDVALLLYKVYGAAPVATLPR